VKSIIIGLFTLLLFDAAVYPYDQSEEYKKALSLIESGNRAEAKNILKDLSQKNAEWGIIHLEYAINCIYLECTDNEIEEYLTKAEALLPENPRFYYFKGLFLEHLDKDAALRLYDKAISLRPSYTDVLIRACTLYAEKGDLKSAISYYDSIPNENKSSTLILRMIDLLIENKNYQRAEKELLTLTTLHPSNEIYLGRLKDFYIKTGNIPKANETTKKIEKLSPQKKKHMRPLR